MMKFKKFNKNNKRNTIVIIAIVIIVPLVVATNLIKSHANFNTHKEFNIIQGKIPNKSGDIKLAVFVGEDKYKGEGFPPKENYKFKGYECTNGVELIWNKDDWVATITTGKPTVCTLEFETKTNLNLNGSEPVVKEGLVPVIIANDGTVKKTETEDINWYDYNESKWANAVILTGTDNYSVGQIIPEEAIESYFVWIPKYRYKLFNVEGNSIPEQEIKIEIGDYDTVNSDTECVATNKSGEIGTCENGKWMTHPAFTSLGVNGLWVGKFETTETVENVTIKPLNYAINFQNVYHMYNTSFNYKRNLDSHMMKNTEWGAMAYFTNSKYGKGNNLVLANDYRNRDNETFLSGCVGNEYKTTSYNTNCSFKWNTEKGVLGSTTNNISGIYDTNSQLLQYVMANTIETVGLSGFTANELKNLLTKYINQYLETNLNYILGDATYETNGWGSNAVIVSFLTASHSWLYRAGGQGIYSIYCDVNGQSHERIGFRIVLSPSN